MPNQNGNIEIDLAETIAEGRARGVHEANLDYSGMTDEERDAWTRVELWLHANPEKGELIACQRLGVDYNLFRRALKKATFCDEKREGLSTSNQRITRDLPLITGKIRTQPKKPGSRCRRPSERVTERILAYAREGVALVEIARRVKAWPRTLRRWKVEYPILFAQVSESGIGADSAQDGGFGDNEG